MPEKFDINTKNSIALTIYRAEMILKWHPIRYNEPQNEPTKANNDTQEVINDTQFSISNAKNDTQENIDGGLKMQKVDRKGGQKSKLHQEWHQKWHQKMTPKQFKLTF